MNEDNGNVSCIKPNSSSNEDLSEYTDADESISAPTEILAEVGEMLLVCTFFFNIGVFVLEIPVPLRGYAERLRNRSEVLQNK